MYNLAIRKCSSPLLLKWKFTTPPGIEPRTCWTRGRHATIWASAAHENYLAIILKKTHYNKRAIFFKARSVAKLDLQWEIWWSFAQMRCAMSLVCPSIAMHRTCQFWARSESINMPKRIVFCQMWSACCNLIPLFRKSGEECCLQVLSFFMTVLGRILQLQQRGSWSIFDGKCLITHHHLLGLGSL